MRIAPDDSREPSLHDVEGGFFRYADGRTCSTADSSSENRLGRVSRAGRDQTTVRERTSTIMTRQSLRVVRATRGERPAARALCLRRQRRGGAGALIVVIFSFVFVRRVDEQAVIARGGLWIALVFATTLALSRGIAVEDDNAAIEGLMLAPVDRSAIYLGKVCSSAVFVTAIGWVTLVADRVLATPFEPPCSSSWRSCSHSRRIQRRRRVVDRADETHRSAKHSRRCCSSRSSSRLSIARIVLTSLAVDCSGCRSGSNTPRVRLTVIVTAFVSFEFVIEA